MLQLRVGRHRRAIHLGDDIKRPEITFVRGRVRLDRAHHYTFVDSLEQIAGVRIVADRFDSNAKPGSRNFLAGDQLLTDFVGQVARNSEAKAAVQSINQRVHANDLAVDVAERAPRVTRINRGIGLDVIGDAVTAVSEQFAPAFSADHAIGEGVIEFKWRADGEGKLPNPHRIAVAHLNHRQVLGVDLDHRDVGLLVGADDFRRKFATIFQFNIDMLRSFDHVEISKDVSIRPHDESGAFALNRLQVTWTALLRIVVRLSLKK